MIPEREKKKLLRTGFTTGACAAAAARAAAISLIKQEAVMRTEIDLPGDGSAGFAIERCVFDGSQASCTVIKDAGDDPDATHGVEIQATVCWQDEPGITIFGGKGVGVVTKPGLEMPPGTAAINPVPRQMIERSVKEILQNRPATKGVEVTISVNGGEKLAEKTLNPRLGIVGGISILGTTGIIIPYSVNAYKATIARALDIAIACGCRQVVLTTGRRSEKFAQNGMALPEECFVQVGDFVGYSLEQCVDKKISRVTIWGMTGKISKLAAGHLYTNISDSQVDIGFLVGVAADCGLPEEKINDLKEAVTANHLRRILPEQYIKKFCDKLCQLAAVKCYEKTEGKLEIDCIMSDYHGAMLGRSHAR
ncbi:MAG: hypothetical protein A2144_10310 [Chloroflexi bacterium RBG_16_50_9]|nr:MAG: hypothetical protein A2144_10310 [Chloroflexi bacterium RBG_16_50_9]